MSVDLFGNPIPWKESKHTEVFHLDSDLSAGERTVISGFMQSKALDVIAQDQKAGESILMEAVRYNKCGQEAIGLFCPECHKSYFIKTLCRSRICEKCGRIYRKQMEGQITPLIKKTVARKPKGYVLGLLTLTVTSKRFAGQMPGRADIKRFYKESSAFLRLNYGKYAGTWTKKGKIRENRKRFIGAGWIATIEVGRNNNNLHLHAIIYGPIRQWHRLKSSWEMITGDSQGVDIRAAWKPKQVALYILKYITKPPASDSYAAIADYAISIKGSRRIRTGGVFYNRVKNLKSERPPCRCLFCRSRLIMDVIFEVVDSGTRIDLYDEYRKIEEELLENPIPLPIPPPIDIPVPCNQLQLM